jgi:hypothetical protein
MPMGVIISLTFNHKGNGLVLHLIAAQIQVALVSRPVYFHYYYF